MKADTCRNGHPFTPANTMWEGKGNTLQRRCRTCRTENKKAWKAKNPTQTWQRLSRAEVRQREAKILKLHKKGKSPGEIAAQVGCHIRVVHRVTDPVFAEKLLKKRRAEYRRRMERKFAPKKMDRPAWDAMLQRHDAAMKLVKECSPDERLELLQAVVWPESERLIELEREAA